MNKLLQLIYKKRARYFAGKVSPYIGRDEKVADIGGGSGYIGELLSEKAKITLIDVADYNQTSLPLVIYDGKKIPFAKNSFDAALLITVLHHTSNPEKMLEEVKRVSKKIIVIEEDYSTIAGRIFIDLWEWFWNKTSGISTFYNFHSSAEWKEIFNNLNLNLVASHKLSNSLHTLTMRLFVLEKKN